MTLENTINRIGELKRSLAAHKAWETIRERKTQAQISKTASNAAKKAWATIRAKQAAAEF